MQQNTNMTPSQAFAINWHFMTYPKDYSFDQILAAFENETKDLLNEPLVECTPFYKASLHPNSLCLVVRDMASKLPKLCSETVAFFVEA